MARALPLLDLALRHRGDALLSAASCRLAAELGARHAGRIPAAAVDDVVARFSGRLRDACQMAGAVPVRIDDED